MQFTKSTIALVASLMATGAYGLPAALTAKACGTAPAGTEPQQPLGTPNADTAAFCKEACAKDASCKSFAFGLPPNAKVPECKLFGVEGAQVPKQDSNVMVFDVACSGIPTDKPTQANPVGAIHKARGEPIPPPPPATKPPQPKLEGPKARSEPKPQDSKPQEPTHQEPKPDGPKARGEPIPPLPATKPPQPKPKGPKARGEAKVCGAAAAGPAGRAPQPIKSDRSIVTVDACLALGKATAGCIAVQFSQPADGGAPHCSLFGVSASVLPPKDGAKSDLVFDIGC